MDNISKRMRRPRHLSARLWLITLPSALLSFEKRQRLPRLPLGRWRFLGALPVLGAIACVVYSRDETTPLRRGKCPVPPEDRGVFAGLMALSGVALILRSSVLALYSLGLGLAHRKGVLEIEEPQPETLLDGKGPRILNEAIARFAEYRREEAKH